MNILWSVNTVMPEVAAKLGIKSSHAISWVDAMSSRLRCRNEVTLAIVAPISKPTKFKVELNGVVYYFLSQKENEADWKNIIDDFKPDVIHVYGTEKAHNMPLFELQTNIPIVISLQGILTEYERFYYGGIDVSVLIKNTTIRDIVRGTIFAERKDFQKRAVTERKMLNAVKYVEGRTDWDRVAALKINKQLKYYHCPRLLRDAFYSCEQWNADKMDPHTIFVHQGNYPIKGLHFVFEALHILKQDYPDVRLCIAGNDVINKKTLKQKLLRNGYSKYLKSLIDKYDLCANLEFTGYLGADQLAMKLSRCNVMVIPSAIENSPNSLAEAEIVGVPCVASYVGGNGEMLRDYEEGYLYCYNEPALLAEKIRLLFESREQCKVFSNKARERALKRHDPQTLEKTLLGIYESIMAEEEKVREGHGED